MKLANKEAAIKAYDALDTYNSLENAIAATKVLEEWTTFQNSQKTILNMQNEETKKAAADLLKKIWRVDI